jgi:hypothetical protein
MGPALRKEWGVKILIPGKDKPNPGLPHYVFDAPRFQRVVTPL